MADLTSTLTSIESATSTTDKVLDVADPKRWLNLIMTICLLLIFIIILIFLVKKVGGNAIGSLWDFVSKPFRRIKNNLDSVNETGVSPTISSSKAKEIANSLYYCFTNTGDDEESVYNILSDRVHNYADWYLIKAEFGERHCPKAFSGHNGDLEHIISHNFTDSERAKVRSILNNKGVKTTI